MMHTPQVPLACTVCGAPAVPSKEENNAVTVLNQRPLELLRSFEAEAQLLRSNVGMQTEERDWLMSQEKQKVSLQDGYGRSVF